MSNQIRGLGTKDLDTSAGVDNQAVVGILLPTASGSVVGGTTANPIVVSQSSLPLPTGAATDATLGTIGTSPPTLPSSSTGLFGMLRLVYATLLAGIGITSAPVATAKYTTPTLSTLTTGTTLDSKADGTICGPIYYDNTAGDEFGDLGFILGSFTPGSSPTLTLKCYSSIDGTNYEDNGGADNSYQTTLTTGASIKRANFHKVKLFPFKMAFYLTQGSGGTTAGSGNSASIATFNYKAV